MTNSQNRRRFERFALRPMYSAVTVRPHAGGETLEGHAYDVSEGGLRFELDSAIEPGTAVEITLLLPAAEPIEVRANVIWADDDGVPGPVRMAAAFTAFAGAAHRERLLRQISAGRYARAA